MNKLTPEQLRQVNKTRNLLNESDLIKFAATLSSLSMRLNKETDEIRKQELAKGMKDKMENFNLEYELTKTFQALGKISNNLNR